LGSGLGAGWNGDLVLEVPSSRQVLERVLGVTPGSYTQIAAVAWPEGPDASSAAVRILVNPDLSHRLDAQALGVLIVHEATHVATRSAASPAPTWLVEGFADFVAYAAHPRTSTGAATAVSDWVKTHGPPSSLPSDAQFAPTEPSLELTYAEAWLACRLLAETYSAAKLDRFYLQVDSGKSVDEALGSVFGLTTPSFTRQWSQYLQSAHLRS
jgi:acetolactate synthase regulatory subunit